MSLAELPEDALPLSSMTRNRTKLARDHGYTMAGNPQLLSSPANSCHTRNRSSTPSCRAAERPADRGVGARGGRAEPPKAGPAARRWLVRYLSEGTPGLREWRGSPA